MPAIYLFLYLIFSLAIIKSMLFWIYLWQVKEYRLDRFLAEYGEPKKLSRFWLLASGRNLRRPQWTLKAILLFATFLIILGSVFISPSYFILPPIVPAEIAGLFNLFVFYFFTPLLAAIFVFFFSAPTFFIKRVICKTAARRMAKMENLLVVGITGSYGKSSTKEFLAQILAHKFTVARTPENINSEIGVANWILKAFSLNAKNQPQIAIVEMGAYKIGEIKRICKIVKPHIGILTGIDEQHLALFGSLENTKKAKFELIEALPKSGKIVLDGREISPMAFFSGEDKNVLELAQKWRGSGFIYRLPEVRLKTDMPRHYEINLEGAISVARYLGMTDKEIDEAVRNLKFTDKLIKTKTASNGMIVIDDTYSANPDGVLAGLDYLGEFPRKTKLLVMPCLIELGEAAPRIHQKIGEKIFEICDFAVVTTADYYEDMKKGSDGKAILETNPDLVLQALDNFMKNKLHRDAAILLEGRISQRIIDGVLK